MVSGETYGVAPKRQRNSSIELLQLVSMLMIVGFHYVRGGNQGLWIASQPISFNKFVYQMIYMSGGWIGNFIFFTISVWFLLDRCETLNDSLKRIWLLERELLFWSLTLLVVTYFLHKQGLYTGSMLSITAKSIFPISLNMWWYPTSYALFLLFMPFLIQGVRALGENAHKKLAIACLVLWGVLSLIPKFAFDLTESSVFVFIYWFVLIAYYRWYMEPFTTRRCWQLIGVGFVVVLLYWAVTNTLFMMTGKMAKMQSFIFDHWKLPMMMIGFGLFLLVERREFHNRIINVMAASAFGVYLIHFQSAIYQAWTHYLGVPKMYTSSMPILMGALTIVGVFFACLLLDMVRQLLFALTIDRHKGRGYERMRAAWVAIAHRRSQRQAAENR